MALLVSGLITTPNEDLEDYRKKRLGRASTVPLDHLARARAVLITVAGALQSDDDDHIATVEEIHRLIHKTRPPSGDEVPAAAASAPAPAEGQNDPAAAPGEADDTESPSDEGADDEAHGEHPHDAEGDGPVPRPPRVGEGPIVAIPAVAPSETPSPWANPTAALTASRPSKPEASRPPSPEVAPAPADIPPPPLVAPAGDGDIADDDDDAHTARPTSSGPPEPDDPPTRHPRAGETAAPPASVTADAGAEIPTSPVLPFVGTPKLPTEPDGARAKTDGPWALPFASSPTATSSVDDGIAMTPPRFPRAEPDDDEPTMASITRTPGARSATTAATSEPHDELDTRPAAIGGAALAHMTIPDSALSLTDYAALCAICGAFPAHLSDTYLRFGLRDHTERYSLDEAWHAHFANQPEAQALWKSLFTQFRSWLTQYGRL